MSPTANAAQHPALAALKDIQTPEAIGSWPLAAGYWILASLSMAILIGAIIWLRRRTRRLAPRRAAIKMLNELSANQPNLGIAVNSIIKRAVMSYLPRLSVNALNEQDWLAWLDRRLPEQHRGQLTELLAQRYRGRELSPCQADKLKALAGDWLGHALPLKPDDAGLGDCGLASAREARC